MESNYKMLATKVSPETYERISKIASKKGISIYQLNQMVIDTLVRYMDDKHNLTPEMEQAMSIFEHMRGWKDHYNWADPTLKKQVQSAIYFVGDPRKKGVRASKVESYMQEVCNQSENIQEITEFFLCKLMPERYRRLRALAVEHDCGSIIELLDIMIDNHTKDADLHEIRKEFEDANRSEYGKKPKEDGPYKRKHHKSVEMYEQQPIVFESEEQKWLEENSDFRPFGSEW